jgi:hypothetical protein
VVRWSANGNIPLKVEGLGLFDCNLYTQPGCVIAHVVNLTDTGRMPIDELIPSGPVKVSVKLPAGVHGRTGKMLVSGKSFAPNAASGWATANIPSVLGHEVLVIE